MVSLFPWNFRAGCLILQERGGEGAGTEVKMREKRGGPVQETGSNEKLVLAIYEIQPDPPPAHKGGTSGQARDSQLPLFQGLLSPAGPSGPTVRCKRELHFA